MATDVASTTIRRGRVTAARITSGVLGIALLCLMAPIFPVLFSGDAEALAHRTHEISFVVYGFGIFIAAMLAVAIRPNMAPGALRVVVVAAIANAVITVATTGIDPFVVILLAAPLIVAAIGGFPVWRDTWMVPSRMVILPGLMMVGFAAYAWNQIGLQLDGSPADPHVEFGHYAGMAVVVTSIALAGLVASAPINGRYYAGMVAGVAAVALGAGSLLSGQVSSFGLIGELALIIGGLTFVGQVQMERLDNPAV